MHSYTVNDILEVISGEKKLVGKPEGITITNLKPISEAGKNSLVWLSPKKAELAAHVGTTEASLVIVSAEFDTGPYPQKCFIQVPDPRLTFIQIATALFSAKTEWGVHPTASIHPKAKIHPETYIGAFTYIGNCEIDRGTVIFGHCYLYDGIRVGKNVRIHAGTVIGTDGFGYQRDETGALQKFPHYGGVIIEDEVEIGSNTVIDRGTLGDTIIRKSAKIDNLVHVAHNANIGIHTVVIANAEIGGSDQIGDYCWIAPSSTMRENLKIGSGARVGLGAVVMRDVPENANMIGNPAIDLRVKDKK